MDTDAGLEPLTGRLRATLVALVAVIVACAGMTLAPSGKAGATTSASAARHRTVYWINLGGTASQHPRYVSFTVSSGGYMKHVKWKGWGKRKTVGRGLFGTTGPCYPGEDCTPAPATMTLRKPVRCTPEFGSMEGKTVLVYRHARLTYPDFRGGTAHADISDRAGWQICKQAY